MNQVHDLAPLGHAVIDHLGLDQNQVQDLGPIAQMSLQRLDCGDNGVTDLTPLTHAHLQYLECADNPLSSLEPLVADPPPIFLFDGGTFPLPELKRVAAIWQADGRHADLAQECQILLAAHASDINALRSFAKTWRGHAFLLVPMAVTWEDALAHAQALGGHLVCIHDQATLDFVTGVVPHQGSWIGLRVDEADSSWVDGLPLGFNVLPAADVHIFHGPIRMDTTGSQTLWFARDYTSQRMPYVIEWDK